MNNVLTKKFPPKLILSEFHEDSQIFIQEYSCPLCEGILKDSVIDRCGHSYCRNCIDTLLKETNLCPFTNIPITDKTVQSESSHQLSANIVVNSVIEKQKVYCKHKSENCQWIGKLLERRNHLLHDCEKELVECEYSAECSVKVSRDEIASHLRECPFRIILCHHCQSYVNFNKVEEHYKSCALFPILCSNGCGESIPNSKLNIHIETQCLTAIVECAFNVVSCDFLDSRRKLKVHLEENLEAHLKLITRRMRGLEDVINVQKTQINNLELEKDSLKNDVENCKKIIAQNHEDVVSSINTIYRNMENMKLYFNLPQSNFLPNYFDVNIQNNNSTAISQIFKLENDNFSITKIQENYGWYGVSSESFDILSSVEYLNCQNNNTKESFFKTKSYSAWQINTKIIINMKIIKTSNSCIMFGITFSNLNSPLQNGFYQQTDNENISYMFYAYNSSMYLKGRSMNKNAYGPCIEGDVISMIIDTDCNTLSFRKNGNLIVDPFDVGFLNIEEYRKRMRICVDLCDYKDKIMFLI